MTGFDFGLDENGELIIDTTTHEIHKAEDDDLRIQLAYTRLKSVSNGWFYDNTGANMEELVGKPVKNAITEMGVDKIKNALTFDGLWSADDIYIETTITDSTHVIYSVYLRTETNDEFSEQAIALTITLDLVKGVIINYGWK